MGYTDLWLANTSPLQDCANLAQFYLVYVERIRRFH